jgi:hypothetical protein
MAVDGIPVAVTRRVLEIGRQPYYRWLVNPVPEAEQTAANRANVLFDAHRDDPEFGYRFLVDEALVAGEPMAERTARKICSGPGLVVLIRQEARRQRQEARTAGPRRSVRGGRRARRDAARVQERRPEPAVAQRHHGTLDR